MSVCRSPSSVPSVTIVIEADGEPAGITTDRDVALAIYQYDDVPSVTAEEIMTEDPATSRADEDPIEISRLIERWGRCMIDRVAIETPTALDRLDAGMTDDRGDAQRHRECEICGESVPAAVYREHLLKACPGGDD